MQQLYELFRGLPLPSGDGHDLLFSTAEIAEYPGIRIGRDKHGYPCLLIASESEVPGASRTYQLEHLQVHYAAECILKIQDTELKSRFTVLRLTSGGQMLQRYFCDVVAVLAHRISGTPTAAVLHEAVMALIELFRKLAQPARTSLQGLWAELFLIYRAGDTARMVRAWRADLTERYDFGEENARLEVKSASGRERSHIFALEQLRPPAGVTLVIASLLCEPATGGPSIIELCDNIRQKLNGKTELLTKFEGVVAESLGDGFAAALGARFDHLLAQDQLRFFPHNVVPSLEGGIPAQISEVRFRCDLTAVEGEAVEEARCRGGLFAAL